MPNARFQRKNQKREGEEKVEEDRSNKNIEILQECS